MIANRLFLLGNALALLLVVGQRSSLPGGGLDALPWASFGTELQDIVTEASLSSAALLCLWIVLTAVWSLFTLIAERRQRIETAARSKNSKEPSDQSDQIPHTRPSLRADASSQGLHDSSAHENPGSDRTSTHGTGQSNHLEHSLGGATAQGAHEADRHSTHSTESAHSTAGRAANTSDISGVLAGVKERNKSLSPEARAEIARLQAALQTLSDQASEEKKRDGASPDDVAPSRSAS